MCPLLNQTQRVYQTTVSYYSRIISHCLSVKSLTFAKIIHSQLLKSGFNSHTFLGNQCLDLYCQCSGSFDDILTVFSDITCKNTITWNICLKGMLKFGHFDFGRSLFDEMPERDVVSWNSMISGFASYGYLDSALGMFREMQYVGVRPSGFTYSIMLSLVSSALHGKELHGSLIRGGMGALNVVIGNSLVDMYGKIGHVNYAFTVFLTMQDLDVITWNSLISGFCKSGNGEMALNLFGLMRSSGYSPDEFTCSALINSCSNLRNLEQGKQIFAFCLKLGFLCNTVVSSAAIDLFSSCNRLKDSVKLFDELEQRDSALLNSMISSYAGCGFEEDALQLFVLSWRENIRPTDFTMSCVLTCISMFPAELGAQVHSLVVKLGFELDDIVASSLVEMYAKFGLIDYAMEIFKKIITRDLISWNTMIMGLAHNGRVLETLEIYEQLLSRGPPPDRITLAGVLLACSYGDLLDEGMIIFSSMQESFRVIPGYEHYACIVDLLCRAGRFYEAMQITEGTPYEPSSLILRSVLHTCLIHGDLKLAERVAERLSDLEPQSSLSYWVLAQIYQARGQWEGMVRIRKTMESKRMKIVTGCSWIGIRNHVYTFNAHQLQHCGGEQVYLLLRLLDWQVDNEGL